VERGQGGDVSHDSRGSELERALTEALLTYTLIEVGPDALVLETVLRRPEEDDRPAGEDRDSPKIRLTADDRNELAVPLKPDGVFEEDGKHRWFDLPSGDPGPSWTLGPPPETLKTRGLNISRCKRLRSGG